MDKETLAMIHLVGKSVRIISFKRKRAFTVAARYETIPLKKFIELAETPVHEDFENIVSNVVQFAEYEWERIMSDRFNTDNDYILLHDDANTQLWNSGGTCVWKRVE